MDNCSLHESKGVVYDDGGGRKEQSYLTAVVLFLFPPTYTISAVKCYFSFKSGGLPLNCKPTAGQIFKGDQFVASSLIWCFGASSIRSKNFGCLATKTTRTGQT